MHFFAPKCPVEPDDQTWIEDSFGWLIEEFGVETFLNVTVVLPTDDFFPEPFSPDPDDVRVLVDRVCNYMGVEPTKIDLELFADPDREFRQAVRGVEGSSGGRCGSYQQRRGRTVIAIDEAQCNDPNNLVATVAHELGHVRLLGEARLHAGYEDHEPMTDLLTVFFGLGIFTGNSSFQFTRWSDGQWEGWEVATSGYLTEAMFGYALALFAWLRNEEHPNWGGYLTGSVASYFKGGLKYLKKNGAAKLRPLNRA